jgi:hypothetical protein
VVECNHDTVEVTSSILVEGIKDCYSKNKNFFSMKKATTVRFGGVRKDGLVLDKLYHNLAFALLAQRLESYADNVGIQVRFL